jgi:hypothetical protein
MSGCRFTLAAGLALAALVVPSGAAAQSATDSAAAQALFDAARTLMDAGEFAQACPKLAESQRLDPAGGTLVHLATCHEREGKLASAWAEFREAIDVARRDKRADREAFAQKHVEDLAPKVAQMTIILPGKRAVGLEVRRDGVTIAAPSWGTPVPVDRGPHTVEASAPGYQPWRGAVDVERDGSLTSITVPPLEPIPPRGEAMAAPLATERPWQRPLAAGVFGVGAIGVVLGSVFGLVAKSRHDDAASQCTQGPSKNGCTAHAVELESSARGAGDFATVAFIVGGAALAGGAVLWLTAPSAEPRARVGVAVDVPLSAGRAGLVVRGAY